MIVIQKGQINNICLTLTEKVTLSNPYFLFEVYSIETKSSTFFICTDTSNYKYRYNKFSITEKDNPTLTNSEVSLEAGDYQYKIYEQNSSTNLTRPSTDYLVEEGKLKVTNTSTSIPTYTPNSSTIPVYNG